MATKVNLAPEVYQSSQRSKQRKKFATGIAAAVSIFSVGVVIASVVIIAGQETVILALSGSIKDTQKKIEAIPDLKKAVTTQQHLDTWQGISGQNAAMSKFFQTLQDTAPTTISVSKVTVDQTNKLEATGTATNYNAVTKLAKALEASNIEIGNNASPTNTPNFSDVKITSASTNPAAQGVEFKITAQVASEVTRGN